MMTHPESTQPDWLANNPWLLDDPTNPLEAGQLLDAWSGFLDAEGTSESALSPVMLSVDPIILEEGIFTNSDQAVGQTFDTVTFGQGEENPVEAAVIRDELSAAIKEAVHNHDYGLMVMDRFGLIDAATSSSPDMLDPEPKTLAELGEANAMTKENARRILAKVCVELQDPLRPFVYDHDQAVGLPTVSIDYPAYYAYDLDGRATPARLQTELDARGDEDYTNRAADFNRTMEYLDTRKGFAVIADTMEPVAVQIGDTTYPSKPADVPDTAITAKIYEKNQVRFDQIRLSIQATDIEMQEMQTTRSVVANQPKSHDIAAQLIAADSRLRTLQRFRSMLVTELLKTDRKPVYIAVPAAVPQWFNY